MKHCTNCEHGIYDYGLEKLFCKGEIKQNNTPCAEWEKPSKTCRTTYSAWNRLKGGLHGY